MSIMSNKTSGLQSRNKLYIRIHLLFAPLANSNESLDDKCQMTEFSFTANLFPVSL